MNKLEKNLIRVALARYREWVATYGQPNPLGKNPNVPSKKGHAMLMATKAVYDAKLRRAR